MSPVERLGIVGVGLIGGSLGLAARRAGLAREIVGLGRSRANLDIALARGIVDRAGVEPDVLAGADLVVLATPVSLLAERAAAIAAHLAPGAVVTDVGSVKAGVVDACSAALGARARFVGSHPIAGTEEAGAAAASVDLFAGARCVVTPIESTDGSALERVRALWDAVGMEVVLMSPEEHDAMLALTSHLPHLLAFSLVRAARERAAGAPHDPESFAGPSFRSATRVAASAPEAWRDILLANREALGTAVADFTRHLNELARAIRDGDQEALLALLERGRARTPGKGE